MKGYVHRGLLRLDPSQAHSSFTVWANPKSGEPSDWIEVEVTQIGVCGVKSLEELAEIGHDALRIARGNVVEPWAVQSKEYKAGVIAQTIAIIREVLGPVSKEESWIPSRSVADANFLLQCRLYHYTRTAKQDCNNSPQKLKSTTEIETNVAISDDEVERVANYNKHPDLIALDIVRPVISKLTQKEHVELAKSVSSAIAAMGGQKRWGVFAMPEGFTHKGVFIEVGINGQTSTTDKALCEDVAKHRREVDKINNEGVTFEVREYTTPAAEIPREAIAAGAKAVHELFSSNGKVDGNLGDENIARAVLTAAIRHLKGGE